MEELKIELVDNTLTAEDFIRLKVATGFMDRPLEQVEKALENAFSISPLIVRNAALDSSFSPNHLANIGFYTSKASANIIKAIKKLSPTNTQGKN